MLDLIGDTLARFFSLASGVIGNEANYQASLQHLLQKQIKGKVLREHRDDRTGKGGIDVVVWNLEQERINYAFEIKGGAYGDRNALNDTFDATGYCTDFDKLLKLDPQSVSCWMVAIDALELGRGLGEKALKGAISHAIARNIGFAYYALGEKSAVITYPGGKISCVDIETNNILGISYKVVRPYLLDAKVLSHLLCKQMVTYEKEADIVGHLYSKFIDLGCSPKQLSLETYFGFAPGAGMHQRPDLCVYNPEIGGRFNLYPDGDRSRSNDEAKLSALMAMIEVKGSKTLISKSDGTLLKTYESDLSKMNGWKLAINEALTRQNLPLKQIDYTFIGLDHRKKPLSGESLKELIAKASQLGVNAHYLHCPI